MTTPTLGGASPLAQPLIHLMAVLHGRQRLTLQTLL